MLRSGSVACQKGADSTGEIGAAGFVNSDVPCVLDTGDQGSTGLGRQVLFRAACGNCGRNLLINCLKAGPDMASLNMGTMNYSKYSRSRKSFVFDMAEPFWLVPWLGGFGGCAGISRTNQWD